MELFGNVLELLEIKRSISVLIEDGKYSLDSVLGFSLSDSGGDDI